MKEARLINIGSFGSEGDLNLVTLKYLLEINNIEFSVVGRNYHYYEGSLNSGISILIKKSDYEKMRKVITESDNQQLKNYLLGATGK